MAREIKCFHVFGDSIKVKLDRKTLFLRDGIFMDDMPHLSINLSENIDIYLNSKEAENLINTLSTRLPYLKAAELNDIIKRK